MGRRLAIAGSVIAVCTAADAQQAYAPAPPAAGGVAYSSLAAETDIANLRVALNAARTGDIVNTRAAMTSMQDPLARKVALWALTDSSAESLSFSEVDESRRGMAGWPREGRRVSAAEKLVGTAGLSPPAVIAWFAGREPQTADGAMALAQALSESGQAEAAGALIRRFWRDEVFEADVQARMLARFGQLFTMADHGRRADILLYGAQGPAARDMLRLLGAEDLATANVRIALRSGARDADALYAELTPSQQFAPGVAFERAAYLRKRDRADEAIAMARYFPAPPPSADASARIWIERRALIAQALRVGSSQAAYDLAANTGITTGADGAEAEFYAGWLALTRLRKPNLAEGHFAALAGIGQSPITRGRALYWQGRAAEASGDPVAAAGFFGDGARYQTTFYGQLAAEKAGQTTIALGNDPVITPAHRQQFENNEMIRAARLLNAAGAVDAFKAFILAADDVLATVEDQALLVDLALSTGDQDLAMRAARTAAQRNFILPQRGYPVMTPPSVQTSAEPAFTLSIARQESNFSPTARSGVGARGMMQLMPATARLTARRIGEPYSEGLLNDAQYNMRLGSTYLGNMIDTFSGSYLMAAAAYNAGPGRPAEWSNFCGDPRSGANDPLDFIECIPFSETRNYVMRTLETTLVYRARLNGGSAPLTLSSDLKRGRYTYTPSAPVTAASAEIAASDSVATR